MWNLADRYFFGHISLAAKMAELNEAASLRRPIKKVIDTIREVLKSTCEVRRPIFMVYTLIRMYFARPFQWWL